jgi:RNA polymerase sigma-70 factor, ECF subfamily
MAGRPGVRNDADAVVALFDRALPDVYHYLLHRCGQRAVAEDLTSETFLAAVAAVRGGAVAEASVGWLIGIARHKLIDHWRRSEREERRLRIIANESPAEADVVAVEPGRGMEVLAGMGGSQRAALTLRHVDGLSVPEVASLLGRSVTATETLLTRARTVFRDRYSSWEAPDD